MSINRIFCPNCGSTENEDVGIEQYKCKVCNSKFNFTRPNDGLIIQDIRSHHCPSCGKSVKSIEGHKCTKCNQVDFCEKCVNDVDGKLVCLSCYGDKNNFTPSTQFEFETVKSTLTSFLQKKFPEHDIKVDIEKYVPKGTHWEITGKFSTHIGFEVESRSKIGKLFGRKDIEAYWSDYSFEVIFDPNTSEITQYQESILR